VKNQKYETEKKRLEDKEQTMSKRLEEDQALIENLKEELARSLENQANNQDGEREENDKVISELAEKIKILENNVKHKEELVRNWFYIFLRFFSTKQQKVPLKKKKQ